ncbi:sulfotransferase domain-containing protein [Flexibacterium corallicola]|uniref:sulfotransferase domain-containing protein n=1 Tax=Flexibacterium corallicola TaxID=3037259 RepID=UPI00286F09A3|nr:sulfotransferase domain-containing protein [Pseudovibrio sp. M1P-2-3]
MRTFILGVGTQKSGTTWFFNQLKKNENFKAPFRKEMHIFDAKFLPKCGHRRSIERSYENAQKDGAGLDEQKDATLRYQMLQDPEEYFRYYDRLLSEENSFTADITPTYAAIPADGLKLIKSSFERLSISVKVVYFIREPVTRLESMVRMSFRRQKKIRTATVEDLMQEISALTQSRADLLRSSYDKAVNNIHECFGKDNVYIGFYETMFNKEELARLSEFLSIDPSTFDGAAVINGAGRKFKYSSEFLSKVKEKYNHQYDFVSQALGFDRKIWDQALVNISNNSTSN